MLYIEYFLYYYLLEYIRLTNQVGKGRKLFSAGVTHQKYASNLDFYKNFYNDSKPKDQQKILQNGVFYAFSKKATSIMINNKRT